MTLFRSAGPLAGLVAVAAVLRFQGLDRQSFWSDESITALLVRLDAAELLDGIARTESAPPLYYVLAWLWGKVFGTGEVGLRSLSAVFGVLTVPVAYGAAATLLSRRSALAAAALVAVNPLLIWYSQEARAYALLVLLCGISFWAFGAALSNPGRTTFGAWWLASSLALSTHYFAVFVVAAEDGWLLAVHRRSSARFAVAGVGATALALLPLALHQRAGGQVEYIADSSLSSRVVTLGKQLLAGLDAPHDQVAAALLALFVGVAMVLLLVSRNEALQRGALVAGAVGLIAIALSMVFVPLGLDYVNTQNSLGVVVPLITAVAAGLAVARPRVVGSLVLGAACILSSALVLAVAHDKRYHRADWRGALRTALADPSSGGRLIVIGPDYEGWFARAPALVYAPEAVSVDHVDRTRKRFRALVRRSDDDPEPTLLRVGEIVFLRMGSPIDRTETVRLLGSRGQLVAATRGQGFEVLRYRLIGAGGNLPGAPSSLGGDPVATLFVP